MFDFTASMLFKDLGKALLCIFFVSMLTFLYTWLSWKKSNEHSFTEIVSKKFHNPTIIYGASAFAFFLATYASRLVLVKLLFSLLYSGIIFFIFMRQEKNKK